MPIKLDEQRWKHTPTCKTCGSCDTKHGCDVARTELRDYSGIRFTADGFDCALPISIDSHSRCSFGCLYCFSDNTIEHREQTERQLGQMSLSKMERIFSGEGGKEGAIIRKALKYDRRNAGGYPTAVQLGAITDPTDNIERQQGWLLKFMDIAIKYKQPVRISTKGKLLKDKDYLDKMSEAPELFWVAFSIISPDDKLMEMIDWKAPTPSERIATMKALGEIGVKTSLRFRPITPGISDRTKRHQYAYKDLIWMAADAGAKAISYEVAFYPALGKQKFDDMSKIVGMDLTAIYKSFGRIDPCARPSYIWTEGIMHAIRDEAKKAGMTVGVSDPVWKQLSESGCCCGIVPEDPVFGNWQEESATNQLLLARDTGKEITLEDITPAWALEKNLVGIVNPGTGPTAMYSKNKTWSDLLKKNWNNPAAIRSPMNYFQGALQPSRVDENGNLVYRYVGLERHYKKAPYWKI